MLKSLVIGDADQDADLTDAMLDTLTSADPTKIPVFSTFDDLPVPIGHCARLRRVGQKLWADLEIADRAYWPGPNEPQPGPLHGEGIIGWNEGNAELLCVVVTSMPEGMLGPMLQEAFGAFRQSQN